MVNRAIAGVVLVMAGGSAVSGCSGGEPPPTQVEVPSYGPTPPGYVDPATAASRQFTCLKGTPFDALEAIWRTTRIGDPGRGPQEIGIGALNEGEDTMPMLRLRRESWQGELKPMDAESKRILSDHKCPVTW